MSRIRAVKCWFGFCMNLSQAIDVVARVKQSGRKRPHWFDSPVKDLIASVGDKAICDVTADDVLAWYDQLRLRPSRRRAGSVLSPWTVDSYGRAVRSFFNTLVAIGHLDRSPARVLRLPRLPAAQRKDIAEADLDRLIQASEYNARDHALVLVLRDTGCRVGELVDMILPGLDLRRDGGRILITDQKTHASRFVFVGAEAVAAIRRYLRSRPHDAPDWVWLSHRAPTRLTTSGVYQALERIADRAGVADRWNPHAFRHALAKRLVSRGAPAKVVQELMGHKDITTTLNMYVTFDADELAEWHRQYLED